jgi:hypothetical protein
LDELRLQRVKSQGVRLSIFVSVALKAPSATAIINDTLKSKLFKLLIRKENMANVRNGNDDKMAKHDSRVTVS